MPKLREILEADQRAKGEAALAQERERRQCIQRFLEGISPFLTHIKQTEVMQVIEDLVLLAGSQEDVPRVAGIILYQNGYVEGKDEWGYHNQMSDRQNWWKGLGDPKKWLSDLGRFRYFGIAVDDIAAEKEISVNAVGFRVYLGHHTESYSDSEMGSTEDWSHYIEILSEQKTSDRFALLVKWGYGSPVSGLTNPQLTLEPQNPSLLDEAVADIYLKSLQPQKGKV